MERGIMNSTHAWEYAYMYICSIHRKKSCRQDACHVGSIIVCKIIQARCQMGSIIQHSVQSHTGRVSCGFDHTS